MNNDTPRDTTVADRQRWMRVLAMAPVGALEDAWNDVGDDVRYSLLRAPEIGTAMVRARAGGAGARFNMGEMTVTRCAVRMEGGATGYAYVAGRDKRKTELAAAFDALLRDGGRRARLEATLIAPLETAQQAAHDARAQKVAATRVDFFTMVRGED